MTPEQREAADIIVFWRKPDDLSSEYGTVRSTADTLPYILRLLREQRIEPVYAVRWVKVRPKTKHQRRNNAVWFNNQVGQWIAPRGTPITAFELMEGEYPPDPPRRHRGR